MELKGSLPLENPPPRGSAPLDPPGWVLARSLIGHQGGSGTTACDAKPRIYAR